MGVLPINFSHSTEGWVREQKNRSRTVNKIVTKFANGDFQEVANWPLNRKAIVLFNDPNCPPEMKKLLAFFLDIEYDDQEVS